jgi:hypothetical protein
MVASFPMRIVARVILVVAIAFAACGKKEMEVERKRAVVAPRYEAPPDWLPLVGPPAGREPCAAGAAKTAKEAATACYTSRVLPALLAVAKTRRLRALELGSRDQIERNLAFAPRLGCSEEARPGEPRPEYANEPLRTVLGDAARISTTRRYFHCNADVERPNAAADTGYYLGFYVDEKTLETVYVYAPDCC